MFKQSVAFALALVFQYINLTNGFAVSGADRSFRTIAPVLSSSAKSRTALFSKHQLSEIDSMCLMNTAEYCAEGECSLDDVEALLNQLQDQADIFSERIVKIGGMLAELGVDNESEDRDVPALRKKISVIGEAFKTAGKPSLEP
mmetsp:Transcript_7580/g.9342  ORF Transcript_7580/g.9342 Transcript_7580/m.9342 type:complete len:144 (+) Transcript_7580:56-487(+)|eukprot:CAMPEP_0172477950 /NCGR_PEP_ID=MMETSP1066-20121228/1569_1 /TAXON_ID=671091 /ORGANISM="Coscinodiscus wailesii, Strain CCMP2513" /LENGTH=143 /DNA_ID=CAMNT_0013237031 /DNA_START=52 /DNA_END=483 /DNA_ORIENTATION=+